jgi:DNA-binding transcriptional ArsR family regulator
MNTQIDQVLRALSDPTRRSILDVLEQQAGLTTGQLAERIPSISRWGVMKHLAVLRSAGLVQTLDEGRRRRHYRELAPLRAVHAWIEQQLAS